MDKLIISGPGFPGTNELLQFMDDAQRKPIEGIGLAFGYSSLIVSGIYIKEIGGVLRYQDGYILLNGELLPFRGGDYPPSSVPTDLVVIEEITESGYDTANNEQFNDIKPVWKKRWTTLGTLAMPGAVLSVPFDQFKHLTTIEKLTDDVATLNTSVEDLDIEVPELTTRVITLETEKIQILKKGQVNLDNSGSGPQVSVTGNFTNAFEVFTNPQDGTVFRVEFPEIIGEYFPILNMGSYLASGGYTLRVLAATSTHVDIGFKNLSATPNSYNVSIGLCLIG